VRWLHRRVVRVGEWVLIVALFMLMLAAASQQNAAEQMLRDPFGTVAEAFDLWRSVSPW
jgi:hypothetical protein